MPVICATGIVTRYVNYRENDRILSIFTIDHGRIDAKARGCRRPASPLLPAAQPFVYGEFELFAGRDKYTVNQCAVEESFFPIREDIDRFAVGSAMLQLAHEAVQEREPNRPLFSLLYHALSFLAYAEPLDPVDLFLCYLLRYLNTIGYCPAVTSCAAAGATCARTRMYMRPRVRAVPYARPAPPARRRSAKRRSRPCAGCCCSAMRSCIACA